MQRTTEWILAVALCSTTVVLVPAGAAAQPAPGSRIRWVTTTGSRHPTYGRVVSTTADTLIAMGDRDSLLHEMAYTSIVSLESPHGRGHQVVRFAFIGAAAGALCGVVFAKVVGFAAETATQEAIGVSPDLTPDYTRAALIGGGVGAVGGAVVGAVKDSPERWEPVSVADHPVGIFLRAGAHPQVGLSLRY